MWTYRGKRTGMQEKCIVQERWEQYSALESIICYPMETWCFSKVKVLKIHLYFIVNWVVYIPWKDGKGLINGIWSLQDLHSLGRQRQVCGCLSECQRSEDVLQARLHIIIEVESLYSNLESAGSEHSCSTQWRDRTATSNSAQGREKNISVRFRGRSKRQRLRLEGAMWSGAVKDDASRGKKKNLSNEILNQDCEWCG